jgi:hypothetical protein
MTRNKNYYHNEPTDRHRHGIYALPCAVYKHGEYIGTAYLTPVMRTSLRKKGLKITIWEHLI